MIIDKLKEKVSRIKRASSSDLVPLVETLINIKNIFEVEKPPFREENLNLLEQIYQFEPLKKISILDTKNNFLKTEGNLRKQHFTRLRGLIHDLLNKLKSEAKNKEMGKYEFNLLEKKAKQLNRSDKPRYQKISKALDKLVRLYGNEVRFPIIQKGDLKIKPLGFIDTQKLEALRGYIRICIEAFEV